MMRAAATDRVHPERLDRFGATASCLCAVHCAVCALLPTTFGALGLGLLLSHEAEWVFTLVAVVFATGALILGWRRHQSVLVAGFLAVGIAGLLTSRGLEISSAHHNHYGPPHDASMEHAAPRPDGVLRAPDRPVAADARIDGGSPAAGENTAHFARSGSGIGIVAGLLLLLGHIFNIRASRQRSNKFCA